MKTIQSRILNAIEAMVASDSPCNCVVVDYADHTGSHSIALSKGESWSINTYHFVTDSGKVSFKWDTIFSVELSRFVYNPDGTKCIAGTIAKF